MGADAGGKGNGQARRIAAEIASLRFRAEGLSARQIRRRIYG